MRNLPDFGSTRIIAQKNQALEARTSEVFLEASPSRASKNYLSG
jgi:hypothetical protein